MESRIKRLIKTFTLLINMKLHNIELIGNDHFANVIGYTNMGNKDKVA